MTMLLSQTTKTIHSTQKNDTNKKKNMKEFMNGLKSERESTIMEKGRRVEYENMGVICNL